MILIVILIVISYNDDRDMFSFFSLAILVN